MKLNEQPDKWTIFAAQADAMLNIDLNWCELAGGWHIAEGYAIAAEAVANTLDDRIQRDVAFMPCAFLFRHAFELALKAIIVEGCKLSGSSHPDWLNSSHELGKLWCEAREIIIDLWGDTPEVIRPADQIIFEFNRLDPRGQSFRYQLDKNGMRLSSAMPRQISLESMSKHSSNFFSFLDGCYTGICAALDSMQDNYAIDN